MTPLNGWWLSRKTAPKASKCKGLVMSVIQVEAFDLPFTPAKGSVCVLQDKQNRLFIDPLLMGVSSTEVLMVTMDGEGEPDQYHFDGAMFIELDWLMPLYRPDSPKPLGERIKSANEIKRFCRSCVSNLQGRTVEVNLIAGC